MTQSSIRSSRHIQNNRPMTDQPQTSSSHTVDENGNPTHWWAALPAIPQSRESAAYNRLRRVWFDPTRFHGKAIGGSASSEGVQSRSSRYQEFVKSGHETNLTVSLWENFTLFTCSEWLSRVYAAAHI